MAEYDDFNQSIGGEDQKPSGSGWRRKGRAICQALIIIDAIGAIAFIVMGIFIPTWMIFTVTGEDAYSDTEKETLSSIWFSRSRGLIWINVYSEYFEGDRQRILPVDLGNSSATTSSVIYKQIIALRWTQLSLHIAVVSLTILALLVNLACLMPDAAQWTKHAEQKTSISCGIIMSIAAIMQLVAMVIFHVMVGREYISDTTDTQYMDTYANWESSLQSNTVISYSTMYAFGWCGLACLVYAAIMYLARDQTCKSLGEPIQDDWDNKMAKRTEHVANGDMPGQNDHVYSYPAAGKGLAQEMQLSQLYGANRPNYYSSPVFRAGQIPSRYPAVATVFPEGPMPMPGPGMAVAAPGIYGNPVYMSGGLGPENYMARPPYGRYGYSMPRQGGYMANPSQWY